MLGFVIGDNDMITGFRLVGVAGAEVSTVEEARQALSKALTRKDAAVIILSEEFAVQMCSDIDKARSEHLTPLILEIQGSKGPSDETRMSDLITKTLGIKI
jgi:vacuolar-type H+-ATPase subunit F/Vma7